MKRRTGKVAVIGTTSWGTTLALILGRKGLGVNSGGGGEAES
jgi:glycerol-3-phosphate dehydrogenase